MIAMKTQTKTKLIVCRTGKKSLDDNLKSEKTDPKVYTECLVFNYF